MKKANRSPVYCAAVYPDLAELCRNHGYALAVHGSLARDFDLIAFPWNKKVSRPEKVVEDIMQNFSVKKHYEPELKRHNRLVYTLCWMGEAFMDLSFSLTSDEYYF